MAVPHQSAATDRQAGATWTIRPARASDLAAVSELIHAAGLPVDGVEASFADGYAVAEDHGTVIGVAGVETHGRYGLLRSLVVDPGWRGRRLGVGLVNNRLDWAKLRELEAVYLLTETASGYFKQFLFQPVERDSVPDEIKVSGEYSSLCSQSAEVMRLRMASWNAGLKEAVRSRYAAIARAHSSKTAATVAEERPCCGTSTGDVVPNPISSTLYSDSELDQIPVRAAQLSLGCGNPTALTNLREGETVLDLGSGGGIDVLLSARRVGPTGKAIGLDMTEEMLERARENQRKAGIDNAEFLKGEIEDVPLPDESVDVVISNCVINLSTDKRRVLAEAYRVLRPGGRFAVSDIVSRGDVPEAIRRDVELWAGCVAGSLDEGEYRRLLGEVGFEDVEIEATRVFDVSASCCTPECTDTPGTGEDAATGTFISAFIRATKPAGPR